MESFKLNVNSPSCGGYFSSEQIDLLAIIQCISIQELCDYVDHCDQIKNLKNLKGKIAGLDNLELAKQIVFSAYTYTLAPHNMSKEEERQRRMAYLGITPEEGKKVFDGEYPNSEEIITLNHHFVSKERDQLKSLEMYDELSFLNSQLGDFDTMLIGSGKMCNVVNKLYTGDDAKIKFDFYHVRRDLDFAYDNGKQVRYHSLLTKGDPSSLFKDKSKDQILALMKAYVKESVDFIREYNASHRVTINGEDRPIINAVDLFNEIISFPSNENYYNIWERQYGITLEDLMGVFQYARDNKPEGVSFIYNEPFLENDERRETVLATLDKIEELSPGLIDTLGTQMHIGITEEPETIKREFATLKAYQDRTGKKIQITEFDMSLSEQQTKQLISGETSYTLEDAYNKKAEQAQVISNIINESGVTLSGTSYWSLTDGIDSNLEKNRDELLASGDITHKEQVPTACGGLYPTHKKLLVKKEHESTNGESPKSR